MAPKSATYIENEPFLEKLKHGYHPMTEGVRWSERYADQLERGWAKLPKSARTFLATLVVFLMGTSIQGKNVLSKFDQVQTAGPLTSFAARQHFNKFILIRYCTIKIFNRTLYTHR